MDHSPSPFESKSLFPHHRARYRRLEPDPELLGIEQELRARQILDHPEVQAWVRVAALGTSSGRSRAIERLKSFLQADAVEAMRSPDPFRPYGPASLLLQGDLLLLVQVDGVPCQIPVDSLVTGGLIAGAQGGGKSRAIVSICRQVVTACPPRHVLILDPKGQLASYADYLGAVTIDGSSLALDLSPPSGTSYESWLPQVLPQLGSVIGLIQGIELLDEAGAICLDQLHRYHSQTGQQGELSLKDIFTALPLVHDASHGRRAGYLEAATTGLGRILAGSGTMFVCRQGVPLKEIFSRNIILDLRNLTDEIACKWLAQYLLYWRYQEARFRPETTRLESLLVVDDAQRFLSASWPQDAASAPTPLAHILAVLRSSGTGLLVASQLPAAVDPSVLALSSLILVVGGVHGFEHQRAVADMIGLNVAQRVALGKLATREAVGFCARGAYRNAVHGWVPLVRDPQGA